jgi:hypothetical protein
MLIHHGADRVGFEKPMAKWFRSWWLSNISVMDAGRPVLWAEARSTTAGTDTSTDTSTSADVVDIADATSYTLSIVDSWIAPPAGNTTAGNTTRTIHVYTNAPWVQLYVNGEPAGEAVPVPFFGWATFAAVPFEAGNLTAAALDHTAVSMVASETIFTGTVPSLYSHFTIIVLSLYSHCTIIVLSLSLRRSSHVHYTPYAIRIHYTHTIYTGGAAAAIKLVLDAPSPMTGTGPALVADGQVRGG